jgi:hypothetical protein
LPADQDRLTLRVFDDLVQARLGFRGIDGPHDALRCVPALRWFRDGSQA